MIIKEIKKLGIIAGSDLLPRHVVDACKKNNIPFVLIGLTGNTTSELFKDITHENFALHSVSKVIKKLKNEEVTHLVFAGKVRRSSVSKLLLDVKGAKLLTKIIRAGLSDNAILSAILEFFENEGFKIVAPEEIAEEIVVKKGKIANLEPSKENWDDIKKAVKVLKGIAEYDVGQALIIQGGLVLGVEAAEGTDALIKRCGSILQQEDNDGILVKICKPKQDKRVDLPCIGYNTIQNLHKNGLKGVAIEAGAAIILDEAATVNEANKLGIFIYGI